MSAKDVIVEVLKKYGLITDLTDKYKEELGIGDCDTLMGLWGKVAQQILDSLPKLSRDKVKELSIKLLVDKYSPAGYAEKDIDEIVNKICSLVPEHKWVQTTDDKGNVIVPLGEVVASGEVDYDEGDWVSEVTIGNKYINDKMRTWEGQSGALIWVPDKEVEDD